MPWPIALNGLKSPKTQAVRYRGLSIIHAQKRSPLMVSLSNHERTVDEETLCKQTDASSEIKYALNALYN